LEHQVFTGLAKDALLEGDAEDAFGTLSQKSRRCRFREAVSENRQHGQRLFQCRRQVVHLGQDQILKTSGQASFLVLFEVDFVLHDPDQTVFFQVAQEFGKVQRDPRSPPGQEFKEFRGRIASQIPAGQKGCVLGGKRLKKQSVESSMGKFQRDRSAA